MLLQQALELVNVGKLTEARGLLETAPTATAAAPEALRLLAKLRLNDGDKAAALDAMSQVAKILPDRADIQFELGIIAIQVPDQEQALRAWNNAVRLAPDMTQAHYNLGCLNRERGDIQAAETNFLAAVHRDPNHVQAWFNLGNIRFEKGDLLDAIQAYESAGGERANSPDLLVKLSQALLQAGQLDRAFLVASQAGKLAPDTPSVMIAQANCLASMGQRDEALHLVHQVQKTAPRDKAVVIALVSALTALEEYESALDLIDQLLDDNPGDSQLSILLKKGYEALDARWITYPPSQPPLDGFALVSTEVTELYEGKNKYWFNTQNTRPTQKPTFLVLTSGNCGAIWFASALNLHERLFAGCGIDHPIESCFRYNLQKSGPDLARRSHPEHYRHGVHPDAMRPALQAQGLDYPLPPRAYHRLPWTVFDEIETLPGAENFSAIGSVHAFTAASFSRYYKRDHNVLGGRRVVVANMIRHPIPRLESFIKAFAHYHLDLHRPVIDRYVDANLDECLALERQYGISMQDPRIRASLFTFRIGRTACWVARELKRFRAMTALRMEDLQDDRDYFIKSFRFLTSDQVVPDQSYLDRVFTPENLGVGRRGAIPDGTRPPAAESQWREWSEWERQEFRKNFLADSLGEIYGEHGYDFSFMR